MPICWSSEFLAGLETVLALLCLFAGVWVFAMAILKVLMKSWIFPGSSQMVQGNANVFEGVFTVVHVIAKLSRVFQTRTEALEEQSKML